MAIPEDAIDRAKMQEELRQEWLAEHPCPDARRGGDVDYCLLNDRVCLLEGGEECSHYEEDLKEKRENHGR